MKGRRVAVGVSLFAIVLLISSVTLAAVSPRYKLGEEIQFQVEDSTTWSWGCCGCCTCDDTLVLGWRIVNTSQQAIYSVIHDAPVSASAWLGSWTQIDSLGGSVAAGQYKLVVDTSVGTLSRCFSIYDPCGCYWCNPCCSCVCEDVSTVSDCSCRTSLVFVDSCQTSCFRFPLFWGWRSCGCSSCP